MKVRNYFTEPLAVALPIYMLALVGVELISLRAGLIASAVGDSLILLLLLNHYIWLSSPRSHRVLPVLALVPLMRLLSIAMPVRQTPQLVWYLFIAMPLLAAIVLAALLLRIPAADLGLRLRPRRAQSLIALSGLPLGVIGYLLLRPHAVLSSFSWAGLAAAVPILVVCVGCTEELLFRGLLQSMLLRILPKSGLFWGAVLYAGLYAGSQSFGYALFMGIVALFFGWCVRRTGGLGGVIFAHSLMAVGIGCIWPYVIR